MIGTWEILESGKGGGVGRKIPLTADWRKNRDEPRTSQGVTGDPFHPQGLAQPLFRNFPQAALASYSSLERDLPCHRVWTHVRSDKSRDARTPEEGPVRGLQVKVVPWEGQEQGQEARAKGTLAKFALGSEHLAAAAPIDTLRVGATRTRPFPPY